MNGANVQHQSLVVLTALTIDRHDYGMNLDVQQGAVDVVGNEDLTRALAAALFVYRNSVFGRASARSLVIWG